MHGKPMVVWLNPAKRPTLAAKASTPLQTLPLCTLLAEHRVHYAMLRWTAWHCMTCTPTAHSSLVFTVLFALIPGALQRHTRHPKTKDTAKTLHRHPPAKTRAPTDCTHCKDTHCERCCHYTRVASTHLEGKRTELKKWGKWTILKVLYSYCIQHLNLCVSDCKVFITCPVGQSIGGRGVPCLYLAGFLCQGIWHWPATGIWAFLQTTPYQLSSF